MQIKLMISLSIPPLPRLQHLRRNTPLLPPLLLHLLRHLLGGRLLLGRMVEDGATVLGSGVGALAVFGGGVVHLVEEFEEGGVGEAGGVEGHLEGFRIYCREKKKKKGISNGSFLPGKKRRGVGGEERDMERTKRTTSPTGANSSIARIIGIATNIPNPRIVKTFLPKVLAEEMFDAPEASSGDGAFLRGVRDVLSATFCGTETHFGGRGEGAEETRDEVGHQACHDEG